MNDVLNPRHQPRAGFLNALFQPVQQAAAALQATPDLPDDLFEELGLPPIRIATPEGDDWVVGAPDGGVEPVGEVRLSRQELWRSTTGRRPRAAVRAYAWTVDPEPYLPAWAGGTFKYPED